MADEIVHPSKTREYYVWKAARSRCYNPRNKGFDHYGGRGITMCDEWRDDVQAFLRDMGPRPSPKHSIERIDNDGPYSPDNCRWGTRVEQASNTTRNNQVTLNGETHTLTEWARRFGVKLSTIYARLDRGWTMQRAITTPSATKERPMSINGVTRSIAAWARHAGIEEGTLRARLRQGWSLRRAVSKPLGPNALIHR